MESVRGRDKILCARRDLLGDPLSVEVFTWLRPVYVHPSGKFPRTVAKRITELASILEPELRKEGNVGAAVHGLSKFVSTPLGPHYVKMFESIKRPGSGLLSTFVSLIYAKALLLLASTPGEAERVVPCFKDILAKPGAFETGLATHGKLNEHFVGHLITLAEIEAQLDPYFHRMLKHSAEIFVGTHRPAHESSNPLADSKSGLEFLTRDHQSSWWWPPTGVAFALTVWSQEAV